jgi:hypothetical protein
MWTRLSQDDLLKARDTLTRRQVEMAARHLQEMKVLEDKHGEERHALEAKLSQLAQVERLVGAFVQEYLEPKDAEAPREPNGLPQIQVTVAQPPSPEPVEVDATKLWKERFRIG